MTQKDIPANLAQTVSNYASQCVKCALCLPHCPTYELTKDENESPRGRIDLFQALAREKLPLTAHAKQHLDQCLGCRACERVCPAHVEYGQLLTHGRALLNTLPAKGALPKPPFSTRFLSWIATKPSSLRALFWLLWLADKSGLRRLGQVLKITKVLGLKPIDDLLQTVPYPKKFRSTYEAIGKKRGRVKLFTGCISSVCDQETLAASIFVLQRLGMEVHIPSQQTCCGAIALHAGQWNEAAQLAKQNCDAFIEANQFDAVITTATGCSAVLQEYGKDFSSSTDFGNEKFSPFSQKVIDIVTFIQQSDWPAELILKPLPMQVLLHTPCTRRNVLKSVSDPEKLLARIPQLSWTTLKSPHCCGAAGTYMLDHPSLANPLADQLLAELDHIKVSFIATSNIGCALHLQKQLKQQHRPVAVGHPVTLFARALGF